ncbi:hypothetical protein OUZ56_026459 [Daphnia magna]|uniref:Peptidase A2 domain-containing protein n=1 Tax=Daphnia magna TaxID=35525 RepID=A0ABQ9ZLV0_9CRUS|nr:hypothetical protein OUZ56_026459 [Daphnia magna]
MKRQFTQRQPLANPKPRNHNLAQPEVLRRASVFCDFYNTYGFHTAENCFTKYQQRNETCTACQEVGHCHNFYPTIKKPRPPPPTPLKVTMKRPKHKQAFCGLRRETKSHRNFVQSVSKSPISPRIRLQVGNCSFHALVDSGAGKSQISSTLFNKLQQEEEDLKYSMEVAVDRS